MERIIEKADRDPTLQKLKQAIMVGHIPKEDEILKPYRKVQDEISISDSGLRLRRYDYSAKSFEEVCN